MAKSDKNPKILEPYKFQRVFSAKRRDEQACWLNGIARNPDTGHIYVMDRENSRIKHFSSDGELLNTIVLVDYLHSMILVQPFNKIVITKPEKLLLVVLDTSNGQIKEEKDIQTEKNYYGICQLNMDSLAASSWSHLCIDIINLDGRILQTITKDPGNGTPLFGSLSSPDLVCVISGSDIVVTSVGSVIICMDQNGHQKWSRNVDGKVTGITSTRKGTLYASFRDKSKIMKLQGNDQSVPNDVLISEHSFGTPIAVCVSDSSLLITTENGDVYVYTIDQ